MKYLKLFNENINGDNYGEYLILKDNKDGMFRNIRKDNIHTKKADEYYYIFSKDITFIWCIGDYKLDLTKPSMDFTHNTYPNHSTKPINTLEKDKRDGIIDLLKQYAESDLDLGFLKMIKPNAIYLLNKWSETIPELEEWATIRNYNL